MFKRIPWDAVLSDLRVAGLLLLTIGAVILIARMVSMRREEADKLAAMPLED
jgi:hypothetical protein